MDTTQNKTARSGAAGTTRPNYTQAIASVSSIEHALSFIDARDQETWIDCGMAIESELGDAGFDTWDRWSVTADNYNARIAATRWKSFKASGGVGIGTLFYLAKQNGYQCDSNNKPTPPTPEEIAQREAKRKTEADLLASRREAASGKAASIWNAPASALEATQPAIADHGYGIASKTIRLNSYETPKGFELSQFSDAFVRYLSTPLNRPQHPQQTPEANKHAALTVADNTPQKTIRNNSATPEAPHSLGCGGVADKTPILGVGEECEVEL